MNIHPTAPTARRGLLSRLNTVLLLGLFAVTVSGLTPEATLGHEDDHHAPPEQVNPQVTYGAGPLADRIMLTVTSDLAHNQTVTWRTDESVSEAYAELAVAGPGPYFVRRAHRTTASTVHFDSDLGPAHYHRVSWSDLTPETKYAYRVGDGTNWSEWFHFTTASTDPAAFQFVYFGDAQNDIKSMWSRVVREAHSDAPRAAFLLHAGDLVNSANRDAEWGEWHSAGGWLNAMIPTLATPGNHEYYSDDDSGERKLSRHWAVQFGFPGNGPDPLQDSVYYIDYQGARIVSLNSMEHLNTQAKWLDAILSDNPQPWTIVTFHFPIFSAAQGRDNRQVRAAWKKIFDQYSVDLVLQGHDHSYARSGLGVPENLDSGANVRQQDTVYVVSVSGPKQYDVAPRPFQHRVASGVQLYQIISIDGGSLRYEARLANGTLYDAFTLNKRPGERNELIEQIPATPEWRKPE